MLTVSGNSKIKPLGYFEVPIKIVDEEFIANTSVIKNISMSIDVILDIGTLIHGHVHINKTGVFIISSMLYKILMFKFKTYV